MKKLLLIVLMLFGLMTTVSAATDSSSAASVEHRFNLYYWHSRIDVDEDYLDNPNQVAMIKTYLEKSPRIDSIIVYSWSSPEGRYEQNAYLAVKRAQAAKRFILAHTPAGSSLKEENIILKPMAENWEGFQKAVEQTYFRHDREKVLAILKDNTITNDGKKWRLRQLDKGYTYKYLIRNQMPRLRMASWVCVWAPLLEPLPKLPELSGSLQAPKSMPKLYPSEPEQKVTVPAVSLRTNLLVPALNVGVEVPLGNHWSVAADYYYPWLWPSQKNKNCFEFLGWSLEGRYWFGRNRQPQDRLRGHSLGVYMAGGYYDFEKNYRGMQGEFLSPGLDYTYSMAIGRKKNLNLQFTLAVGYIRSWGRTYNVYGDYGELYPDDGTLIWDYVGPTKAAVTLVVPFYRKEDRQ